MSITSPRNKTISYPDFLPNEALLNILDWVGSTKAQQAKVCARWSSLLLDWKKEVRCRENIEDWHLDSSLKVLPHLEKIDLRNCKKITVEGFEAFKRRPELKKIELKGCKQFYNSCIRRLSEICPQLYQIDLSNCGNLTDKGIVDLSENCRFLKVIYLATPEERPNKNITDVALITIGKNCSLLEEISLAFCSEITDFGLKILSEKCKKLEKITLTGCNKISLQGALTLAQNSQKLKKMILPLGFTLEELRIIREKYPKLKVEIIRGA